MSAEVASQADDSKVEMKSSDVSASQVDNDAPSPAMSIKAMLDAIAGNSTLELFENIAGEKLMPDSITKVIGKVKDTASERLEEHEERVAHKSLAGLNKKEQALLASVEAAIKSGTVDSKSALGNKFRSEVSTQGLSQKDIQKFRLQWAAELKSKLESKKTHVRSWSRCDTAKHAYRPLGALIIHLGGWDDPDAVRGGCTAALQCLMLGHPFVKIHEQTRMTNFAIAELSWKEEFQESWDQAVSYYTDDSPRGGGSDSGGGGGAGGGGNGVAAIQDNKRVASKEPATPKVPKQARSVCNGGSGGDSGPTTPRTSPRGGGGGSAVGAGKDQSGSEVPLKKQLPQLFTKAAKVKTSFQGCVARAETILSEIQNDTNYKFAKDSDPGDRLITKHLEVVKINLSPFGRDYLVSRNQQDLKKYEGQRLFVELAGFLEMAKDIKTLEEICDGFVEMGQTMGKMITK